MLCNYKNIFGEENKGVHSYRLFNVAVVDVIATIILALLISRKHFIKILILLFILGIISHRLFCVRSTVDKLLF
jgi:hypothetical protein